VRKLTGNGSTPISGHLALKNEIGPTCIVVRVAGDAAARIREIRETVMKVDPDGVLSNKMYGLKSALTGG